eukprot:600668_1
MNMSTKLSIRVPAIMPPEHQKGFADTYDWYDPLLVLCDVYIFKTVYLSLQHKEAKNAESKIESQTSEANERKQSDDVEVKQHASLWLLLFVEALTESFLQTFLQSLFILHSASDPLLRNNAGNMVIVMTSLLGSFTSISNKWTLLDEQRVIEKARSLKPKKAFPGCVSHWYLVRYLWRVTDFGSSTIILLLLVSVLDGKWFVLWFVGSFRERADGYDVETFGSLNSSGFSVCYTG